MQRTWDGSTIAVLMRRWTAGHTAGEIAKDLGVSRNAVIAKAARLGLARHQSRPSLVWARRRHLGALADG
jgi:GcrA cell cycle regulator